MWQQMAEYVHENSMGILIQLREHIFISLLAVLLAAIIGVPLGYLISKSQKYERLISAPVQILRVIPSLAILVLLIPVIGVGVKPAVIALTVLAIPPIMINTSVGFMEIPAFLLECAQGIGMTDKSILWNVRVPLALPLILSGIRTGLVEAIASATLAAKIGAGGIGEIIFTGLGLNRMDLLVLGGTLVAFLSLGCGILFDMLSKKIVYNG